MCKQQKRYHSSYYNQTKQQSETVARCFPCNNRQIITTMCQTLGCANMFREQNGI